MKCLAKFLLAGLLLSTLNCDVVWAQTGSTKPDLKITLRIYNYAHVESETLLRAEQEATRIYRKIGVELVWLDEPLLTEKKRKHSLCQQGSDIDLIILAHKIAEDLDAQSSSLGVASGTGRQRDCAYSFYDRVEDLSRKQIVAAAQGKVHRWATTAQILGYAMAHEVGHLLGVSHSPTGIMREAWRWNDLLEAAYGDLDFTSPEAEAIRTEVQTREH